MLHGILCLIQRSFVPRILILYALTGITLYPCGLQAQQYHLPRVGKRLRITAPTISSERIEGELLRVHFDEIDITSSRLGGGSQSIPIESIERVQVEAGIRHYTLQGMAVGAGVGLVLGTLYIVSYDEGIDDQEEGVMLMVAVTGGILAGLIIGSVVRGTRWEDVSPASLRLGSKGGLDIHLAFGVTP